MLLTNQKLITEKKKYQFYITMVHSISIQKVTTTAQVQDVITTLVGTTIQYTVVHQELHQKVDIMSCTAVKASTTFGIMLIQ